MWIVEFDKKIGWPRTIVNRYAVQTMKIVVSGGTGFLGEPLCRSLLDRGEVVVLSRSPGKVEAGQGVEWHPPEPGDWQKHVHEADVVINLAGDNIGSGRWTSAKKERLRDSRVVVTRSIVESFRDGPPRPRRLLNASAVGYYGDRGEMLLDEDSVRGTGFMADLGVEWEQAAREAEDVASVTIMRFGVAIGEGGGALGSMVPIFKLGLGGRLGSGQQWMSWIDRKDLIRMINWIIDDDSRTGIYNVTSPEPVRNRELTEALGDALGRPTIIPAPAFGLRLVLGEMADEMLLASQRVVPRRAMEEGFDFEYPDIHRSMNASLK